MLFTAYLKEELEHFTFLDQQNIKLNINHDR